MTHELFAVADGTYRHALKFGAQKINLHQLGAEFEPKTKSVCAGSADLCFLTGDPLRQWEKHLVNHGVPVEAGPVSRTSATGALTSLYVRDPDGNLIEVSVRGLF